MKGKEISPEVWTEIRSAYVRGQATLAELALRYGIGKSTLMNKSCQEGWTALKKAGAPSESTDDDTDKTDNIDAPQIKRSKVTTSASYFQETEEVINNAILILNQSLPEARVRSAEATVLALCKLLELRQKLAPPTAADLAERVLELGISPYEFVKELREKWNLAQESQKNQTTH